MKSKIKKIIRCRKCWFVFENKDEQIRVKCPKCGEIKDARDRKEWAKRYLQQHPERLEKLKNLNHKDKSNKNLRKSVLFRIGGLEPHCSYCGCDDVRLLEVNHRFGGGG